MKRVLILGGGFGGLSAAHTLRKRLDPQDEIILVDRRSDFMVGFRKTWILLGEWTEEQGTRPLANLVRQGIQVVRGNVDEIDSQSRAATVDGRRMEADALVVALGAEHVPDRIPGFREHGFNVYSREDLPRAAQALRDFRGGRIVVGVLGGVYACPPAPYELALLVKKQMDRRGIQADMALFSPQPRSIPILGDAGCNAIEGRLADAGIQFLPNHHARAVLAGRVILHNGALPFDLLLGVPPHACPAVVAESGLTDQADWVQVNARTLETRFEMVYAVGDLTAIRMANGNPLPKAGVLAEGMGQVAAERIAAALKGQEPRATFDGEGGCFLEVGDGKAVLVHGRFMAQPLPQVKLTEASEEYVEAKRAFELERLNTWLS